MTKPQAVLTVGLPGCGKSTHAANMQGFTEVNLDHCRFVVSGDAANQTCTPDAVKLHTQLVDQAIADRVNLVVSDTNLNPFFRDQLVTKLQAAGFHVTLLVFDVPFDVCLARNNARDRVVPLDAMQRMQAMLQDSMAQHTSADDVTFVTLDMQMSAV